MEFSIDFSINTHHFYPFNPHVIYTFFYQMNLFLLLIIFYTSIFFYYCLNCTIIELSFMSIFYIELEIPYINPATYSKRPYSQYRMIGWISMFRHEGLRIWNTHLSVEFLLRSQWNTGMITILRNFFEYQLLWNCLPRHVPS